MRTLAAAWPLSFLLLLSACSGPASGVQGDDDVTSDGSVDTASGDAQDPSGPPVAFDLVESTSDVLNPERGFYVGYNLVAAGDASGIRDGGHTLAIAEVRLDAYRNAAIDDAFLTSLSNGFAQVRAAGIKVVLRFVYNDCACADAPLSRVLGHIAQLTPLLQDNHDVIAVLQAGFIGGWGEWHDSTNGLDTPANRAAILDALLTALPADRQVDVRTPMFKDAYAPGGPMDASSAYDGSPRSRVGHHNDCFLASPSDYGTYDAPVSTWEDWIAADTQYTSMGGETCAVDAPRSDCDSAVAEMSKNHWSYLNTEYNQNVLGGWSNQGCMGEVQQRLGYRFAVDHIEHTGAVAPGGVLALSIDLHNSGFSAPFNARPVEIVIVGADGTRRIARVPALDARRWAPGTNVQLGVSLRIPANLPAGAYSVGLRLPDGTVSLATDPRYAIALANDGVFDDATGDNLLSDALVIDPAAPGAVDPQATTFAVIP